MRKSFKMLVVTGVAVLSLVAQATPAHAYSYESGWREFFNATAWVPGPNGQYTPQLQSLCANVALWTSSTDIWAHSDATRRWGHCGDVLHSDIFAGGMDNWIHLLQANSVFGLIECGSSRGPRTQTHWYEAQAVRSRPCPNGQVFIARGTMGGQLWDRYFEPATGDPGWVNSPSHLF